MRSWRFLGNAQLAFSGGRDGLAQGLVHQFLVEQDVDAFEGSVIRGQAAVVQRNRVHPFLGHILLGKGGGDFAGTVVAEIVEDDGIAFFNLGKGLAGGIGNDAGFYEFIGHVGIVRSLDGIDGGRIFGTHAAHQHVVGLFDAVPAVVSAILPSSSSRKPRPLRGSVSRPSINAWT